MPRRQTSQPVVKKEGAVALFFRELFEPGSTMPGYVKGVKPAFKHNGGPDGDWTHKMLRS